MPVYNLGVIPTKPSIGGYFGLGMLQGWEEEKKKQSPEYRLAEMKLKALQDADTALRTQALTGISPLSLEKERMTIQALQQMPELPKVSALTGLTPETITIGSLSEPERRTKFGVSPEQLQTEQTRARLLSDEDVLKRILGAQSVSDKMKEWSDLYNQNWVGQALQTKAAIEDPYGKQEAKLEAQKAQLAKLYAQLYKQEAETALRQTKKQSAGKPLTQASATKSLVNLATDLDQALAPSGLELPEDQKLNVVKDRATQTINIMKSLPEDQRFDENLEIRWVAPYLGRLVSFAKQTTNPKIKLEAVKSAVEIFEQLDIETEPTVPKLQTFLRTMPEIFDTLPTLEPPDSPTKRAIQKGVALTIASYKVLFGNEMAMQATNAFEPLFEEDSFKRVLDETSTILKRWIPPQPKKFKPILKKSH